MSYRNDDTTEKIPAIEPTQRANNPYEYTMPYYGLPDIPPPPPKNNRHGILWAVVMLLSVALLVSLLFIGVQIYGHSNINNDASHLSTVLSTATSIPTRTPTYTPIPTPTDTPIPTPTNTPTRTINYTASDIYNDFYANGLGGKNPTNDTNWKCCTYTPAGGAVVWNDSMSGWQLDIATFYNNADAEIDASDLYRQGFYSNVVHNCLLSYEKQVPVSVLSPYVQLMQTYCN